MISCINVLAGTWTEGKRSMYSRAFASSAYSFHYLSESVCADPGRGVVLLPVVQHEGFISERQKRVVGL